MLNLRGETEEEHLRNLLLMSTDIPANRKVGDWVSTHVPWRRRHETLNLALLSEVRQPAGDDGLGSLFSTVHFSLHRAYLSA